MTTLSISGFKLSFCSASERFWKVGFELGQPSKYKNCIFMILNYKRELPFRAAHFLLFLEDDFLFLFIQINDHGVFFLVISCEETDGERAFHILLNGSLERSGTK